jgi:hypothetical protein
VQNAILSIEECFNKGSERGKMSAVKLLNKKHSINIDLFAKLGHSFGAGGARNNLGSGFDSREKLKFKSAFSTDDSSTSISISIRGQCSCHQRPHDTIHKAWQPRPLEVRSILLIPFLGKPVAQFQSGGCLQHMQWQAKMTANSISTTQ